MDMGVDRRQSSMDVGVDRRQSSMDVDVDRRQSSMDMGLDGRWDTMDIGVGRAPWTWVCTGSSALCIVRVWMRGGALCTWKLWKVGSWIKQIIPMS